MLLALDVLPVLQAGEALAWRRTAATELWCATCQRAQPVRDGHGQREPQPGDPIVPEACEL